MLIAGLLLPWLVLAAMSGGRDGVTSARYFIAPAVAAALALVGVFSTEAGPTPDFWIGLSASLAALAAAGFVLIIQGFMPLEWWVKDDASHPTAPPADPAS